MRGVGRRRAEVKVVVCDPRRNRLKALYRGSAKGGSGSCPARAERLYPELDHLTGLRPEESFMPRVWEKFFLDAPLS